MRLGPYEVLGPLGAGGMGEVWRARDTRLDRTVAIKVLPEGFAADPERRARFEREARAASALNHPHICTLHDIGHHEGVDYIVLEHLEGETLADRLATGALALDGVLRYGIEIAEALAAAHRAGILHRDLKPGNVMLTKTGAKLLDFGLAKRAGVERAGALSVMQTATAAKPLTSAGTVMGTIQYMSPEQLEGKEADARSDIWALGTLIYEMATDRRAFTGASQASIVAAILKEEPRPMRELQPVAPPALDRLVRACLTKDPDERMQSARDVARELGWMREGSEAPAISAWAPRRGRLAWVIAALLLGALAGVWIGRRWLPKGSVGLRETSGPTTHTVIDLPANAPLALGSHIPTQGFDNPVVTLSPDGTQLAYVGQSGSETMLYLRSMSGSGVRPIPGTEGALYAFFSPDSQSLGFLTNDKVKKVSLHGGAPLPLADARSPVLAWWTRNKGIYFTQNETRRLSRVSEDGRDVADVFAAGNIAFTDVLPDGTAALADDLLNAGISRDYSDIVLLSPNTKEKKVLVRTGYGGRYVPPGHLVFARAGALLAVRFNISTLRTEGEEFPVASDVSMESLFGQVHASASNNGLLAYVPGGERAVGKLAWVDRKGNVQFLDIPARVYGVLDLSPDGKRLAVHVAGIKDYIWIYDLERREGRQLAGTEHNGWPVWSPDNLTIALTSFSKAGRKILARRVDEGAATKEIVSMRGDREYATSWLPGGGALALSWFPDGVSFVTLGGKPAGFRASGHSEWGPEFSPDGRWVAYNSSETGRSEIWIRSYPDGKTSHQISVDGGIEPVWCPCGELFFRNGNQWLSARIISSQPELRWDPPRPAFQADFIDTPGRSYDVSPDGQRLIVVKRAAPEIQTKLHLITNWHEPQRP